MDNKKIRLGQFFTKEKIWLKPQVQNFIKESMCTVAYDPFAGNGDLLNAASNYLSFKKTVGLDIDLNLPWKINDSLTSIPHIDDAIIITNPPYIAKQSSTRKKIDLSLYFSSSKYTDVYLIALDKMLSAQNNVVAIIPESFINSSYVQKNKLHSITILEENPFTDTETPVCVACFDGIEKSFKNIKVYKNDELVNSLEFIKAARINPKHNVNVQFNTLNGWLGLRAVDSTNDINFIEFDFKENFKYDWDNNVKSSSRHFSLIDIPVPIKNRQSFINECNRILNNVRQQTFDILLTPFKGNTKKGIRRRRLDFKLARAIMELAYEKICRGTYE